MNSYIIKNENNLYYECGYSCDNAILIKLSNDRYFITDSRYAKEAKDNIKNNSVIDDGNLLSALSNIINKNSIKHITINPKEWTIFEYETLKTKCNKTTFKHEIDFLLKKRAIKSDDEIQIIKTAVKLGEDGFSNFARYLNSNGINKSEQKLFFRNKSIMSDYGKYELSFEPIVAINKNAAKPHAIPTDKKLQKDDLLLVDAGIKYKRYCSDRTRCINMQNNVDFSTAQKFKSQKLQKIYDTVQKAHDKAIEKIKTGMKASDIDKITRDIIEKAGFGKYFIHSTGHGVGLDIHEYPYISNKSDVIIENNMVFTIEPGIYIEDNYGIRIEDMVYIKDSKAHIL
jgi:Xaa-Pro aminopeptidase